MTAHQLVFVVDLINLPAARSSAWVWASHHAYDDVFYDP